MKQIFASMMVAFVVLTSGKAVAESTSTELWYRQPATRWEESVPLGNGRLGASVFGGIDSEHLLFNEDSIWSGWPVTNANQDGAFQALEKARHLIREKLTPQASKILMEEFCSVHGYGKPDFGAYQTFFDAWLDFSHDPKTALGYRRDLDLASGVARVRYRSGDVTYRREYFCSHPDQVAVMRFTADKPASVSFTLRVTSLHKNVRISADGNELVLAGNVETGNAEQEGIPFDGRLRLRTEGGHIRVKDATLQVTDADTATILIAGATNYRLGYPNYKGSLPDKRNRATLERVREKSYEQLLSDHVTDHASLFGRVALEIEGANRTDLPTDERLKNYSKTRDDRGLESLLFQYGRYLLIASSRPGGLPANLQGLWNNTNRPPWNCDYHLNINLQMNYWPAGPTNLSECTLPLIDWMDDLTKSGEKTARECYQSRGWVAHVVSNTWGATAPGPRRGIHMLAVESSAFLSQTVWEHYAFTQDRDYLEKVAWPMLKGSAWFWVDNLQEVEGGFLAVSPSYSPEHGPLSDGAYYPTMIVWDLFTNCIEAAKTLQVEPEFCELLRKRRARIQPLKIGQYGQLCEWRDPALEINVRSNHHRHISHLFAVYPGRQIITGRDADQTAAAIQSMNFRGDAATGWSMGWKINVWARLRDGDRAHTLIGNLVSGRIFPNLWCAHPPFQIDGNFGYTAGVAEMLVQSHAGRIDLHPALPTAWRSGHVSGLCVRGGFEVDLHWKDGKLIEAKIHSQVGGPCKVRYRHKTIELSTEAGKSYSIRP